MKKIILIPILISIVFVFLFFLYENKIEIATQKIYTNKVSEIQRIFTDEVNKKKGATAALTYLIGEDKSIIDALKKSDKTLINFNDKIKKIGLYSDYKNLWLQVIDKNGFSFYRSWTDNVGDNLATTRLDIANMIKKPQEMFTISAGKFDMTFKTILPVFDEENNFIGMIEMISKFNSIANEFKKKILNLYLF